MCLEDVTIARQKRSNHYVTLSVVKIPPNPARIAVTIAADSRELCQLSIQNAQTLLDGLPAVRTVVLACADSSATPQTHHITLTLDDVGLCLTGELTIAALLAVGAAYLTEVLLEIETPYNPDLLKLPTRGGHATR